MKKKIFSVFFALVLVLTMSLVMATPASAAVINVVSGQSIQDAIDSAGSGDIISVAAGTYIGDLVIPAAKTNLELVGATGAIIKGVDTLAWGGWPLADPNIEIRASGVKIHGFTIKSPDVTAGDYSSGIVLTGTDIEIYDNSFVSIATGDGGCVAIQTYRDDVSDISGLNIHDNEFSGTLPVDGYVGVFINHTLEGTGTVTVQDNDFSGTPYQGVVTERDDTVISGNSIITDKTDTGDGIIVMDWNNRAQNNVQVTGNTIKGSSGFARGIVVGNSSGTQPLTNISITQNTIEGNDKGIVVRSSAEGVEVNNNNIDGNITYGVENTDSATLDAEDNWWGATDGPSQSPGSGDRVSSNVDFTPWLTAPVGGATVAMTASFVAQIGISVDPTSVDFGNVVPGSGSDPQTVTVTNTGNVDEDFSAELANISTPDVYTTGLRMTGDLVADWGEEDVAPAGVRSPVLILTVPAGAAAGTYTATLVFWAVASS